MENSENKHLLLEYMKYCKKFIILFLTACVILAIVFVSYSVPVGIIVYSCIICVAVFLPFAVVDYIKFYQKHKQLVALKKSILVRADNLPCAENLIISDYQKLVEICFDDKMKCLAQSKEMRDDLISYYTMWVHQIKTPITAMTLILQDAEETSDNKVLSDVSDELFEIDQYVDMVLNYIKICNTNETDFVFEKYSLDTIVNSALRKYAKLFIKKKLKLNYSPLCTDVVTDKKWLTFVVEQILSNSLKYTKVGAVSIYMDKEKPCSLVIEDTGIGIAKEDLPRIFDNGYTGCNGREYKKSTGLGLYICKTILTKLNCNIQIESVADKGTKVIINLQTNIPVND